MSLKSHVFLLKNVKNFLHFLTSLDFFKEYRKEMLIQCHNMYYKKWKNKSQKPYLLFYNNILPVLIFVTEDGNTHAVPKNKSTVK